MSRQCLKSHLTFSRTGSLLRLFAESGVQSTYRDCAGIGISRCASSNFKAETPNNLCPNQLSSHTTLEEDQF